MRENQGHGGTGRDATGGQGRTGKEVSWLRDRLRVSSWVHWSMQRDSSVIWLLLRLRRRMLPRV